MKIKITRPPTIFGFFVGTYRTATHPLENTPLGYVPHLDGKHLKHLVISVLFQIKPKIYESLYFDVEKKHLYFKC